MNRGSLPGYYFDEEKKKYFKIQATHVAPPNAKYAKSNVKREQRQVKKRKVAERHRKLVRKQTVPAARLLKHPLLGSSGIRREQGDRNYASYRSQRNIAIVNGLERRETIISIDGYPTDGLRIRDVQFPENSERMVMYIAHDYSSNCIYVFDRSDWPSSSPLPCRRPLQAFHNSITGIQCTDHGLMTAFTTEYSHYGGNVFVGNVDTCVGYEFIVGTARETLWDVKLESNTNMLACVGASGGQIHSIGDRPTSLSNLPGLGATESFACEWLDTKTLAVGTRHYHPGRTFHRVYLCDTRADGVALRLKRNDRIIGIHSPDSSGTNLLVSGNRDIGLYDLRVLRHDRPILSIEHTSGMTRLNLTTYLGDLLAATDQDNQLQVYSLSTGRNLRTLEAQVPVRRGLLHNPRWQDHNGSPYLQACASETVQEWAWPQQSEE